MERDWLKTSLVLSPVFALMVGASYYLWLDYRHDSTSMDGQVDREVFGSISFSDNNVKRKSSDSVLWNGVNREEKLYFLDSIRTGPDSYAVIKLRDGSIIELSENSLIVLQKTSNQLGVDFKTGDMRTKSSSNSLAIIVKGSTIVSQGSDLKIKAEPQKNAQIVVTKGKATLTDLEKNKRILSPENLVNIDQKGTAQTLTVPLLLETPADQAQLLSSATESQYKFTWKVLDKNLREETLEVSTDSNFKAESTKSVKAHQVASALVRTGKNYWRVGWKSAQGTQYSETRFLNVREDQRLKLVLPTNGFAYETGSGDHEIEFTWASEGSAKEFLMEISDSAAFQKVTQTQKTSDTKLKIAKLKPGKYWWRVSALGTNGESVSVTAPRTFDVIRVLLPVPILVKPDDGFAWNSSNPVRLEWKKAENAARYKVNITRDKEQNVSVKSVTVSNSPYAWPFTVSGTYYWSVDAMDEKNEVFGHSQVRSFTVNTDGANQKIVLTVPINKAEVNRERKEVIDPIAFEWKINGLEGGNYTLMISKTPGFEKFLKTENIQKNHIQVRLTESSLYYWKVVWSQSPDSEHTETSQTFTLKYAIPDGLPGPLLETPVRDGLVKIHNPAPVEFTWKPVEKAQKYRVVLERFDEQLKSRVPVFDKTVDKPELTSIPLAEGDYFWKVHSLDEKEVQGPSSEERKLKVKMHEVLMAPKLRPLEIK